MKAFPTDWTAEIQHLRMPSRLGGKGRVEREVSNTLRTASPYSIAFCERCMHRSWTISHDPQVLEFTSASCCYAGTCVLEYFCKHVLLGQSGWTYQQAHSNRLSQATLVGCVQTGLFSRRSVKPQNQGTQGKQERRCQQSSPEERAERLATCARPQRGAQWGMSC